MKDKSDCHSKPVETVELSQEELSHQEAPVEDLGTDDDGSRLRKFPQKAVRKALALVAIIMSVFHIYVLFFTLSNPLGLYCMHWAFGLFLIFFFYPATKKSRIDKMPLLDILFAAAVVAVTVYVEVDPAGLQGRIAFFTPTTLDIAFGLIAIVLSLEAGRRTIGIGLPIISLTLVAYALWGNFLPGVMSGKAVSAKRLFTFLFSTDGIFGTPIKTSMEYIFLLILLGAYINISGAGDLIMRFATSAFGHRRGGPAKVSIVSSCLFGSISGSAMANVVSTGIFTIPLMKKSGYRSEFAGAVEAVASTGGQIMPPIMGSGGFIMAELLGLSYGSIALAALLPALLYYFALYVAVDLEAAKCNLKRLDTSNLEKPSKIFFDGWYLLLPLVVLIFTIAVFKWSVVRAATLSIAVCILGSLLNRKKRMTVKEFFQGLEMGAMRSLSIIAACGCAGVAIGAIMASGLGMKFTILVTKLAGANLFPALLFSALAATVLGMGLPTVAAYIISASVLAGSLTTLGVPQLAAHFFLFYYSLLSQITPPVALAAYAAGNIANANPNKVGFLACRLGIMAFILPFFIVYGPALILIGSWSEILMAVITGFIGVYCFTAGQFGWIADGPVPVFARILLMIGSLCMIIPGTTSDIVGIVCLAVGLLCCPAVRGKLLRKRAVV